MTEERDSELEGELIEKFQPEQQRGKDLKKGRWFQSSVGRHRNVQHSCHRSPGREERAQGREKPLKSNGWEIPTFDKRHKPRCLFEF